MSGREYSTTVKPVECVYWLLKALPAESLTPVVIFILYVEEVDRFAEGVTVNVLFELETEGDEDIWTHELKLSEET